MDCPRCNKDKTWDHVIKCEAIRHKKRQFIRDLCQELIIVSEGKVRKEIIMDMTKDIAVHFDNGDEDECTTNQQCI